MRDPIADAIATSVLPDGWKHAIPTFTISFDTTAGALFYVARLRRTSVTPGYPGRIYAYGSGDTPADALAGAVGEACRLDGAMAMDA